MFLVTVFWENPETLFYIYLFPEWKAHIIPFQWKLLIANNLSCSYVASWNLLRFIIYYKTVKKIIDFFFFAVKN